MEWIFTVGALDNIDHNPSSTTAEGSLHGTGISIMQFPTQENQGICREASYVEGNLAHSQQPTLPDIFTNVPAVTINNAIDVPQRSTAKFTGKVEQAKAQEKCWIERRLELLRLDKLQKGQPISWAAYHSSLCARSTFNNCTFAPFPRESGLASNGETCLRHIEMHY